VPVLEVWHFEYVVILKRSRGTGDASVDTPLLERRNAAMLFGDANFSVEHILRELKVLGRRQ
jgi:NAD/NADP transhydrogenase beta subunit